MVKRYRSYKLLSFIAVLSGCLMFWQNCSRVTLEARDLALNQLAPTLNLKGSVCPQYVTSGASPAAILFVVDMSTSNIGAPLKRGVYQYWDKTKATDGEGARFDAIEYFLNNCSAANNSRFAVIGFSDGVGTVTGANANSGTRPTASATPVDANARFTTDCNAISFGNAAAATASVEAFRSVQADETAWFDQWSEATHNYLTTTSFPPIMRGTRYLSALQCADQIINRDLTSTAGISTQNYQVIFLTDGAPNDSKCTGPTFNAASSAACYAQQVNISIGDMRQSALSLAKDLRLSTVFYGKAVDAPGGLPAVLTLMSNDGGTAAPMQLETFKNAQGALCSLVASELSVDFTPDSFFAVNLTTLNQGGILKPDSDMDGIPDDEEEALGFDPANPRSAVDGVLDGICKRLGGKAKCQQLRDAITCDSSKFTNYLSDCDIKIMKLDKVTQNPTLGLDSDGDGLPDFIELIKGTDPLLKDAMNDPDGDGISNQKEINQGSDPFTPDASFYESLKNRFTVAFNPSSQGCTNGGWDLNISQTSVSQTRSVKNLPASIGELNHAGTDQVLWVGYRMVPKNSANDKVTFYGKIVNVKLTDSGLTQSAFPSLIGNMDFLNLGQVLP